MNSKHEQPDTYLTTEDVIDWCETTGFYYADYEGLMPNGLWYVKLFYRPDSAKTIIFERELEYNEFVGRFNKGYKSYEKFCEQPRKFDNRKDFLDMLNYYKQKSAWYKMIGGK